MGSSQNLAAKQIFCLERQQGVYLGPMSWEPCTLQFLLLEVLQQWLVHYLPFSTLPSLTWDKAIQLPRGLSIFPCLPSLIFFQILPQIPKGPSEKLTFCCKNQIAVGGRDGFFFEQNQSLRTLTFQKYICFEAFTLQCVQELNASKYFNDVEIKGFKHKIGFQPK